MHLSPMFGIPAKGIESVVFGAINDFKDYVRIPAKGIESRISLY